MGWTYVSGQNSAYLALRTGNYGGIVAVGVNNTCGQSGSYATKYTSVYGSCGYSLLVTPNPANDFLKIDIIESPLNAQDKTINSNSNTIEDNKVVTYKITITDNMGIVFYNTSKDSRSFIISVKNLANGNYFITADDGENKCEAQFVVKH